MAREMARSKINFNLTAILIAVGVAFMLLPSGTEAAPVWASCVLQNGQYLVHPGKDLSAVAFAMYDDRLFENGWGRLYVESSGKYTDEQQLYAAGVLEGYLTHYRIYPNFVNTNTAFFGSVKGQMPSKLRAWFDAQDSWARTNARNLKNSDPYWGQVAAILSQFDGLVAGYNMAAPVNETLPAIAFTILNGVGDLLDLTSAFSLAQPYKATFNNNSNSNWIFNTHCSALVKTTGDLSDIFIGHTSWWLYSAMSRIAKEYNFPLRNPTTAAKRVIFSSYPGFLESLDDFYITDQKMVISETSLSVFNKSIYSVVVNNPRVILSWQRTLLANRMSATGAQWASTYSQHSSGTYNNQWIVLDYKQFVPNTELKNGTLTILEQVPGLIVWEDMTSTLVKGYWPSYNVAYFPAVNARAGYPQAEKTDQIMASYQTCCRANIFRRDQGSVHDLETFKHILRFNRWQTDPYSADNPGYSISSRFDLEKNPGLSGGIDTKVTSFKLVPTLSFSAINSPTYQDQPVFSWVPFNSASHAGLPTVYDFPFVNFTSLAQ